MSDDAVVWADYHEDEIRRRDKEVARLTAALASSQDRVWLLEEQAKRAPVRTPEEEAVLQAAVAWRQAKLGPTLTWLSNAVDALLAAEPGKWGG